MARVALITGALGGIGRATCTLLRERGWTVVEADLAGPVPLDVRDPASWAALPRRPLDLLVHCAGVSVAGPLASLAPAEARRMVEVNLLGAILGTSASLPHLREGARVVLVGSMLGSHGVPGGATYSATKAGLRALAEALSLEHPGLEVVHLQPGLVDTPMAGELPGPRLSPEEVALAILDRPGLHATVGTDAWWMTALARWAPWLLRKRLARP